MKAKQLTDNAVAFTKVPTFFEYGGWGQEMTKETLDSLAKRYPKNAPVNYNNVGKWGFDCICYIKGLLSGVTVNHHVNDYNVMKANPIGDCTNTEFKKMLYDCCKPEEAPAGYGIATDSHAGLTLGNNMWIDSNRQGSQDGVMIHTGNFPSGCVVGKIPSIDYEEEVDEVKEFLAWAYKQWKERIM